MHAYCTTTITGLKTWHCWLWFIKVLNLPPCFIGKNGNQIKRWPDLFALNYREGGDDFWFIALIFEIAKIKYEKQRQCKFISLWRFWNRKSSRIVFFKLFCNASLWQRIRSKNKTSHFKFANSTYFQAWLPVWRSHGLAQATKQPNQPDHYFK